MIEAEHKNGQRASYWPLVLLVCCAYVIHGVDRSVLLVLLSPIQDEFKLSDVQVGFLSGVSYALPFTIAGIAAGALIDRVNRVRLLATLLAIWSCFTILAGLSRSFITLLGARAMVGAAEGGGPPTMLSLIADGVPPKNRPAMMGIYFTGPFVGIIIGSLIAGSVAAHYGWRMALVVAGVPGLLLALLMLLTLADPKRGAFDKPDAHHAAPISIIAALRFVFASPARGGLASALIMGAFTSIAVNAWLPMFLMRTQSLTIAQAGAFSALVLGACGGAGAVLAGFVATHWAKGQPSRALRLCAIALLVAAPIGVLAVLSQSAAAAIAGLCVWSFLASSYTGPGYSSFSLLLPPAVRGACMAWVVALGNLVGAGLGPQVVGSISDALQQSGSADSLRVGLAVTISVGLIPAALFYWCSLKAAPQITAGSSLEQA